jgi:hypothetical protein
MHYTSGNRAVGDTESAARAEKKAWNRRPDLEICGLGLIGQELNKGYLGSADNSSTSIRGGFTAAPWYLGLASMF